MERGLALDREMACDDAVLALTANPRAYAQCLARVAEKSFLQRQMAMAQAAVSRVRQLSHRVARILDPQRPAQTRLWKPAIPLVAALAVLCAFGLSWTPQLIAVNSGSSLVAKDKTVGQRATSLDATQNAPRAIQNPNYATQNAASAIQNPNMVPASLRSSSHGQPTLLPAVLPVTLRVPVAPGGVASGVVTKTAAARGRTKPKSHLPLQTSVEEQRPADLLAEAAGVPAHPHEGIADLVASLQDKNSIEQRTVLLNHQPASLAESDDGFVLVVVATEQRVTQTSSGVQVNLVQVRLLVPVSEFRKQFPKKI
jgi:hypothetical protein